MRNQITDCLSRRIFQLACAVASLGSASSWSNPDWNDNMKKFAEIFVDVVPFAVNENEPVDPKRRAWLIQKTGEFAALATKMDGKKKAEFLRMTPDADPSLIWLASLLAERTRIVHDELKRGNDSYAKATLKTVAQLCMSCHTRGAFGPEFDNLEKKTGFAKLSVYERANVYAATRRFDLALAEYRQLTQDEAQARSNPLFWERAVREALLIAVRFQNDSERAQDIVNRAKANPGIAPFVRDDLANWEVSVRSWKNEKPMDAKKKSLIVVARDLMAQATRQQKYAWDRSAEVDFMRLSALVHDILRDPQSAKDVPEALYLGGVAYESLRGLGLWSLHEDYFSECIERAPGSALAKQCYRRLEESLYTSYSGSAGLALPENVMKRLAQQRKKSGL